MYGLALNLTMLIPIPWSRGIVSPKHTLQPCLMQLERRTLRGMPTNSMGWDDMITREVIWLRVQVQDIGRHWEEYWTFAFIPLFES
jgi:hypothetical protein